MKSEGEVEGLLRGAAADLPVGEPPVDGIVRRGRRRVVWRMTAVACSIVLVTSGLGVALASLSGLGRGDRAPAVSLPRVARVDVGGRAIGRSVTAFGAFWSVVQLDGAGELALVRIDARTLQATRVALPGSAVAVTAGFDSMLVAGCPQGSGSADTCAEGTVHRVNPSTLEVEPSGVRVGGTIRSIASGQDANWVAAQRTPGQSFLVGFDSSGHIRTTAPDPGGLIEEIAAGPEGIWVLCDEVLLRFDPDSEQFSATTTLGSGLAVGAGAVWVTRGSGNTGALFKIDPESGGILDTLEGSFGQPVVGEDRVWVADLLLGGGGKTYRISRIDPGDVEIDGSLEIGRGQIRFPIPVPSVQSVPITVGEGGVWVSDGLAGQVIRIDVRAFDQPAEPTPPLPTPKRTLAAIERVDVFGRAIRRPVAAYGAFWSIVQEGGGGDLILVRVDGETLESHAVSGLGNPQAVAAGFDSIWVATSCADANDPSCHDSAVVRLDPDGAVQADVSVDGGVYLIAAGERAIWVGGRGPDGTTVIRIDPSSNQVTDVVDLAESLPRQLTFGIFEISASQGSVWILAGERLVRLDPGTLQVTATDIHGQLMTAGLGAVWVNTARAGSAPVIRVDPSTGEGVATIDGPGYTYPAVGGGFVWFAVNPQGTPDVTSIVVYRLDPDTNRVEPLTSVPMGPNRGVNPGLFGPVENLAWDDGILWVTDEYAFQVIRIDLGA